MYKGLISSLRRRMVQPVIKESLIDHAATIQHVAAVFPHNSKSATYSLPAFPAPSFVANSDLSVPPEEFRASYCTTDETYLQSGRDDVDTMRRLLLESGSPVEQLGPILELGVAGGRLIRHLSDLADQQEVWGVDCWASAILWCKENLSPPFHFATTSVSPHLPFEDRTFGLVFAGSVWTHLDDMAEAWTLEVRRVLRPNGRFYFTINDRLAAKFFEGGGSEANRAKYIERIRPANWQSWLQQLAEHREYQRFKRGEVQMFTMGRSTQAHVMWDVDYLLKRLGPGWRVCSVTPEAYGHQTGVLLARR